ncbi:MULTISPECIES: hypothetical protein [Stenotrophomonas]|uniref:hypothetical protein n=1 Tax=Stenotrophomonas TaxID=40323 RepID=UPI0012E35C21|nr:MULTISPECIES: hypothetical protein [Stenotrophomonas]
MERKKPTFSKPDMDEIRFREPARQRKSDSGNGLVWKIAIGVFVGMSICLIATCSLVGIGAAAVAEQEDQARKAAVDEFLRTANDPDPFGFEARAAEERRIEMERRALRPGQRCMQGKRLERIEGGWKDVPNEPC